MRLSVSLLAALGAISGARAQVISWNTVVGNWNVAGNWLPANVPNAPGESAIIGVPSSIVTLNISPTLDSVQITVASARLNFAAQALTVSGGISNVGTIGFNSGTSTITGDLTNSADVIVTSGANFRFAGSTIANGGTVQVNPSNVASVTLIRIDANTSLEGAGELFLGGIDNRAQITTLGAAVLTHAGGHTIRGNGQLAANLVNNGLVSADITGQELFLLTGNKTNNSIMQATNEGILDVSTITITQDPAGLLLADNGIIRFRSSTVGGGTLSTAGAGVIEVVSGTNLLTSITNSGDLDLLAGVVTRITGSGLQNDGRIRINPINTASITVLRFDEDGSLSGNGELVLGAIVNRAQLNSLGGVTITHSATHTIRGRGEIHAALINDGTITADSAGDTLSLFTTNKTNNGIMQAVGGAVLAAGGITITQDTAAVLRANASTIRFSNTSISGGSLDTPNGGLIQIDSGTITLTSVTNLGHISADAGTVTLIKGDGLTSFGLFEVNTANTASTTVVRFDETGVLTGPGELILAATTNRAQLQTGVGAVLTIDTSHTVRGRGLIMANLINNGVISADVAGDTLTLQTNPKTNNAIIRAENGAILAINAITVMQDPAAEIIADASTVSIAGATIVDGTLRTTNDGLAVAQSGTNTLTGLIFDGLMDVSAGALVNVNGDGLANNGVIRVNPSNTASITTVQFTETGTLGGSGSLLLLGSTNRAILTSSAGVTITQEATHTIGGIGQINGTVLNFGAIAPGLPAGTLAINGTVTQQPGSVLDIEIGGTGAGNFDVVSGGGTFNLGGTLRVSLIDGYTPLGNERFTIITTSNRPGRFGAFDLPVLSGGLTWSVEYVPSGVRLRVSPLCIGDANFDNIVNFSDVVSILANFGNSYLPAPGTGPGDSDRTGFVNFFDVVSTLANFGDTCP